MTNPKSLKSIPTRRRIAAQDAIVTGIVGEATKAYMAGKDELAEDILAIGDKLAKQYGAAMPDVVKPKQGAEPKLGEMVEAKILPHSTMPAQTSATTVRAVR